MNQLRKKDPDQCRHDLSVFDVISNYFNGILSLLNDANDTIPSTTYVKTNVGENDNEYVIEVISPGCCKKFFEITIRDDILTVLYENKENDKKETENCMCNSFKYNSFKKSFKLPNNIVEDKISSKYEDGILYISIPKSKSDNVRQIEIK